MNILYLLYYLLIFWELIYLKYFIFNILYLLYYLLILRTNFFVSGISQCSNRYAKANNKYMTDYDPVAESHFIMYFDVNNLYGFTMMQPLPYGGFRWLCQEEIEEFDVLQVEDNSSCGYILEVDLDYSQQLHDLHRDLPFCPEHSIPPGSKHNKLLTTLYDKKNYVVHYTYLQQAIKSGLRLKKIHKVLKFDQKAFLKKYIDVNSRLRQETDDEFAKNFHKLMNNVIFCKTIENVRNRVDVNLVTKWSGRYGAEAYPHRNFWLG